MVDHKVHFFDLGELNGHVGYRAWNESTGIMSIHCQTCPSAPYVPTTCLDSWNPRKRDAKPLVFERHADPRNHPVKGQRWQWDELEYKILRVSEQGRWADIRLVGKGGWSKRQPLPLPAGSEPVAGRPDQDGGTNHEW